MNGTGNTAKGLTTAVWLFFVWAALTCAVRAWVKLKKRDSWSADDTLISASLAVILGRVVTLSLAIHHGLGNPWSSLANVDREMVDELLYASQVLYVISMGLTRMSTSQFTARFLTRGETTIRLAHAITALCGIWTLASILLVALRSRLSAPWRTRDGTEVLFVRWVVVEATALAVDLCAVALSIHFVWVLQMPLRKKISVAALFSCRLLIFPVIALRLWQLYPSGNRNPDEPRIDAYIFTEAALELAFALASTTCLKPFVRPFRSGWVRTTAPTSDGFSVAPRKSQRDDYVELSAARSAAESKDAGIVRTRRTRDSTGPDRKHTKSPILSRPDHVDHEATISFAHRPQSEPNSSEANSHDMSISMTQAWAVTYDDEFVAGERVR